MANIRKTFRMYERFTYSQLRKGNMGIHQTSAGTGGLLAALAINDMAMADRFMNRPGGLKDMIAAGFMPDGWWHEADAGYAIGVANQFLTAAIALRPRGIDWINKGFPLHYDEITQ